MMRTVVVSLLILVSSSATAQDSASYAQMAKASWSAFECSALAAKLDKKSEAERLFKFGYDKGKAFISAMLENKVKREDLSDTAPIGVLFRLEGPTPDFMLGRIFESAQDNALKDVYETEGKFNSDETQGMLASSKFASSNCQIIGNGR